MTARRNESISSRRPTKTGGYQRSLLSLYSSNARKIFSMPESCAGLLALPFMSSIVTRRALRAQLVVVQTQYHMARLATLPLYRKWCSRKVPDIADISDGRTMFTPRHGGPTTLLWKHPQGCRHQVRTLSAQHAIYSTFGGWTRTTLFDVYLYVVMAREKKLVFIRYLKHIARSIRHARSNPNLFWSPNVVFVTTPCSKDDKYRSEVEFEDRLLKPVLDTAEAQWIIEDINRMGALCPIGFRWIAPNAKLLGHYRFPIANRTAPMSTLQRHATTKGSDVRSGSSKIPAGWHLGRRPNP